MSINRAFLPFKIARRELRTGIKGFYVFLLCLILGVTSITAVKSVSRGLIDNLRHDGRYILGGDVALRTIYNPVSICIYVISYTQLTKHKSRSYPESTNAEHLIYNYCIRNPYLCR